MKHKNIILVANDFGFGPTSQAFTIASAIHKADPSVKVRLVTSESIGKVFQSDGISLDSLPSLRDKKILRDYLDGFNPRDTLVVSTMNRFCITSAQELGYKVVLLDGLYWFWQENHPKEYNEADLQIRYVLPWMLKKYNRPDTKEKYFATPIQVSNNK